MENQNIIKPNKRNWIYMINAISILVVLLYAISYFEVVDEILLIPFIILILYLFMSVRLFFIPGIKNRQLNPIAILNVFISILFLLVAIAADAGVSCASWGCGIIISVGFLVYSFVSMILLIVSIIGYNYIKHRS